MTPTLTLISRDDIPPGRAATRSRCGLPAACAISVAAVAGLAVAASPVVVLPVLTLGVVAAIVARPGIATPLALFLVFTNAPAVAVRFHGAPLAVGMVVVVALAVPAALCRRHGGGVVTPAMVGLLGLLVAHVLSTMGAKEIDTGFEAIKTFVVEGVVVVFLVVQAVRTHAALRQATWALLASGAFLGTLTVVQHITGSDGEFGGFAQIPLEYEVRNDLTPRPSGPLGDPNYYAQLLLPLVPLGFLVRSSARTRTGRALSGAAATLCIAGVALTNSRGAGLAFVLVVALMTALGYVRARQVVALVVLAGCTLALVPEYRERLSTLSAAVGSDEVTEEQAAEQESVESRWTEMVVAATVFVDHPVLGVGPGGFPTYYQEYTDRIGSEARKAVRFGARAGEPPEREAHNLVLGLAADLGFVGLVTFLGVVGWTVRDVARARRRALSRDPVLADLLTGYLLAVVGYLAAGLFLTLAFAGPFWALVALANAAATLPPAATDRRSRP